MGRNPVESACLGLSVRPRESGDPGAVSAFTRVFSAPCTRTSPNLGPRFRGGRTQCVALCGRGRGSTGKRDRAEMPPVVWLALVDRAAIAEEGLRLGIGAVAEVLDLADSCPSEPCRDVAGEIEQGMAGALG